MTVSLEAANALERAIDGKIAKAAAKRTRTTGTVTRIDPDGTVFVTVDGSDTETPAGATAAAVRTGERVGVTVSGGSMTVDGNYSAPATDDRTAIAAKTVADTAVRDAATAASAAAAATQYAEDAQASADAARDSLKSVVSGATTVEKAVSVMQTALEAVVDYDPTTDTTQEYFWHDANGAHVLGDTSGYRNDIDSSGMDIVQVSTEDSVAHFGASGARIGKAAEIAASIEKNGFLLRSDEGNGGDPFFSVTMPYSPQGAKVAFMELIGSFTTFPATIRMRYTDDQDVTHDIGSVRDLYALRVSGHDSMPSVEQDVVLVVDYSGGLDGNGGVLPDYVTAYDDAAHTITVDRVGELADVLNVHPYATIEGVVVDSIAYEQPRMLFDVDEAGSLYADYRSLQLIDRENTTYFHVSDLRGVDGTLAVTEEFTGADYYHTLPSGASDNKIELAYEAKYESGEYLVQSVTVNGSPAQFTMNGALELLLASNPAETARISVTYISDDDEAKGLTFGSRRSGSRVGRLSTSFGHRNISSGYSSIAVGENCEASGMRSVAIGNETIAASTNQIALGSYNVADESSGRGEYALIVGNGMSSSARSNALAVDWSGNVLIAGEVKDMGGSSKYQAAISDSGWLELAPATGFAPYASETPVQYRKWGPIIELIGAVKPTAEIAAGDTAVFATLPAGYRPVQNVRQVCQGSGRSKWLLVIDSASGACTVERYSDGATAKAAAVGAWLPFEVTFMSA